MKLNLSEACKLAKNIELFKDELNNLLVDRNYLTKVEETHLKKKAGGEEDEIKAEYRSPKKYEISIEQILILMEILFEKKAKLSKLIESTKHNIMIDVDGMQLPYDSAIEYNKSLRNMVNSLACANNTKIGKVSKNAKGWIKNVAGDQSPFNYEIEAETSLLFDLSKTRDYEKKYNKRISEISNALDEAKLINKIEVDDEIELGDKLGDVIAKLVS